MRYGFADFELEEELHQLRRGGDVVALEPKPLGLLLFLIRNRDRVVRRGELLDAFWPDETVTDSSLSTAIHSIREALGESGGRGRFIRTVPRVGYRFVCPIVENALPLAAPNGLSARLFVGREDEIAALREAAAHAAAGSGSLSLLEGDHGSGKTRVLEEVGDWLRDRGTVVTIAFHEDDTANSFPTCARELLKALARSRSESLRSLLSDSEAAILAPLASALREALPDLGPPQLPDAPEVRRLLLQCLADLVVRATGDRLLALLLDDLQFADDTLCLFLRILCERARSTPILLVGACRRPGLRRRHPLTEALVHLDRERSLTRIHLKGFSEGEVARYVELRTGRATAPGVARAVWSRTDGNPFFVAEIVSHLIAGNLIGQPGEALDAALPPSVRDAIGCRLNRLSDRCNDVLQTAAVIGREFTTSILASLIRDAERDDLPALLDEACRVGIVIPVATVGRFTFSHALVRETLYEEIFPLRRASLHGRVCDALEAFYESDLDNHASEIAYHAYRAVPVIPALRAIEHCLRSGRVAMARFAYEDAARDFGRALDALEAGEPSETRRGEILLEQGEALVRSGDWPAALGRFEAAATSARHCGDVALFARAVLGIGTRADAIAEVDEALVRLLDEALAALPEEAEELRCRILSRLAMALAWSREDRRFELSARGVELARRTGQPALLAMALEARHLATWAPDNLEARLHDADEILRLAADTRSRELELAGMALRIPDRLEEGGVAAARQDIAAFVRAAAELRQGRFEWRALVFRHLVSAAEGRLAEAEALASDALQLGLAIGEQRAEHIYGIQTMRLRAAQGRLGEIIARLTPFPLRFPDFPAWKCALCEAHAGLGEEAKTRELFESIASSRFATIPRDTFFVPSMAALAEACAFLGDGERAAQIYDLLLPHANRFVVVGLGAVCFGSVPYYLGLLAATRGVAKGAAAHFDAAAEMSRGLPPLLARVRLAHGRLLLALGRSRDRSAAVSLLRQTRDEAERLGLAGLRQEAEALL